MGITAKERNDTLANVNRTRTKWGLGSAGSNVSVGTAVSANNDVNNLLNWLREAKSRSGSPQSVIGNISSGQVITNIFPTIVSQSNSIYNYCKCHGNCSGSCSNTCSGGCKNSCSNHCESACQGSSYGCFSGCSST